MLHIYSNKSLGSLILDRTQADSRNKFTDSEEEAIRQDVLACKGVIMDKLNKVIKFSDMCGFTLTFRREYHNDDPAYLHRLVENRILKSRVWKDVKYMMFCEYTKNGILHYHGCTWDCYQIQVIRIINWWKRSFGFAKPETDVKHPDKWIEYITKDYGKSGLWTLYNWD